MVSELVAGFCEQNDNTVAKDEFLCLKSGHSYFNVFHLK
jgi:hypothetical protein